jgi:CRP-like cAMP-binding protein
MPVLPSPEQNNLLSALPSADFAVLAADLDLVQLRLGEMLYEPGRQLKHAYFPVSAVVSLHYVLESGASAEAAGVGNEGLVGVSLFMGGDTAAGSAVVQTSGYAYRLERSLLKQEFRRGGFMHGLLLRYTQALMAQICQTAACNRHHSIEQQLSRWLMLTIDRTPSQDLVVTQQLVASLLGVRRESITEAARTLQELGHINYRRGHITVMDRLGLAGCACECYEVVKQEMRRLMPAA